MGVEVGQVTVNCMNGCQKTMDLDNGEATG